MKLTAEEIYHKLKSNFKFIGADGYIRFNLRDYDIVVEQNNVVGNIPVSYTHLTLPTICSV